MRDILLFDAMKEALAEEMRRELWQRLNAIPSIELAEDVLARRPSIPLTSLTDSQHLQQFLQVFSWFIDQVLASGLIYRFLQN